MGIFGVDVSNHQTSFDFSGWDFAILKSSEGSGFKDRMFHTHLANARRAGCVVAAYHYVRTDDPEYQVGNIESMVPKNVPVILDIEDGAGGDPNHWRHLMNLLRERGYRVPLVYIPRWYWNKIGQPDLSGFPPIWMSWYPDYVARPREEGIKKVPASAWAAMDGVPVLIMQFTSSPFDQNYYPGSKDELATLFNGEDDIVTPQDKEDIANLVVTKLLTAKINRSHDPDEPPTSGQFELGWLFAATDGHTGSIKNKLDNIQTAVNSIQTGGVSEERIADIAVDAVKEELSDD